METVREQDGLDSLKKTVRKEVHCLLCTEKDPISTRELLKHYYNEMGYNLPYQKLGYQTVEALLLDMRDIISCSRGIDGELRLKAVPQAASSHIAALVAGQRKKKKKKSTYTSHFQNRGSSSYSRNSGYNNASRAFNYKGSKPPVSYWPNQLNSYPYITKPMNSVFKPMMSNQSSSAMLNDLRPMMPMMPQTGQQQQQQQQQQPSVNRVPVPISSSSSTSKVVFRPMLPAVEKNEIVHREAPETKSMPTLEFRVMSPPTLPLQTDDSNKNRKKIAGPVFQTMEFHPATKPSVVFRPMQPRSPPAVQGEQVKPAAQVADKPPQLVQYGPAPAPQPQPLTFHQPRPSLFRAMVQPHAQPAGMQMNGMRPSLASIARLRLSPPQASAAESQCPVELNFQRLNISDNKPRIPHSKPTIVNEDVLWVEKLKEIAQRKNLGEPKLQHHELKTTGRFLATITLAGESYLTYPQDFADLMDAYEEAARQACHQLLVKTNVAAH